MELSKHTYDNGIGVDWTLWSREAHASPFVALYGGWDSRHKFRSMSAEFTFGGEERDFTFSLRLWFVSLTVAFGRIFSWDFRRKTYDWAKNRAEISGEGYGYELDPFDGRTTGIRIFDGSIWLELWSSDSWRSTDNRNLPWNGSGWTATLHISDWVLGKQIYEEAEIGWHTGAVDLPEGRYPAKVVLSRVRWYRPRSRWIVYPKWQYRALVVVPDGVPLPGKGTSSYNCDDDSLYRASFGAEEAERPWEEYFSQFAERAMDHRVRYAGQAWVPAEGWPSHLQQA